MLKNTLALLNTLSKQQRQHFFVSFAANLTIAIRDAGANQNLSDNIKIGTIKLINECVHRVLNQAMTLYSDNPTWEDIEVFEFIQSLVIKNKTISDNIANALQMTTASKTWQSYL
jgi:hypothetical protein